MKKLYIKVITRQTFINKIGQNICLQTLKMMSLVMLKQVLIVVM